MKCGICNDFFYIKRSVLDLFNSKKEYICNKCYKKYPISLSYEMLQLENYHCLILSMFKKNYKIDYSVFFKEYSKVFQSLVKKEGYKTIFLDHIDMTDEAFETLDCISKMLESNLIILTFSIKK